MNLNMSNPMFNTFNDSTQDNLFMSNSSYSTQDDGCKLVLGLGPTPSSYCSDHPSYTPMPKQSTNTFTTNSFNEPDSITLQLGLGFPFIDEGSTSAKGDPIGGYLPSLLFAPRAQNTKINDQDVNMPSNEKSPNHNYKKCSFQGCTKGARGASRLCISHGGGHRCHRPGCSKGAESRTAYCKAHGGGRRCQHLGCTKSAEGKTDFCIAHGGGRRCGHPLGCTKAARGKSGLCIKHGGGKRCRIEGCTRSAEGQAGLCISHGGGRRCQFLNCGKGAQGSTFFCKAHGGGKRCVFAGCSKGAEGSTPLCKGHGGGKRCLFEGGGVCPKSVHGGTSYCVAHGGGKRCAVSGCTKSARGRTDCCVRHGGGRRCKVEDCGKSAQGSTDFCKAHGGGKRCGVEGCEKFARGRCGLCASHGSLLNGKEESNTGLIGPGLFKGVVTSDLESSSSIVSVVSDCAESVGDVMIPAHVLVPVGMKAIGIVLPEGRVHGGGLLSLLGGSIRNAFD